MHSTHTIITWFDDKAEEQRWADVLHRKGHRCVSCKDKKHFDELMETSSHSISLVVIDLDLKETDAILACHEIKSIPGKVVPFVIIVGDKAEEYTHVTALDLGADDYILKPVKPQVFLKRVEALLARKNLHRGKKITGGEGFFIDRERHQIVIDNERFELPKKEFELMDLFYSAPNKIFSRKEIAVILWKDEEIAKQRTIDVHIRNIRRILGKNLIKTVKGFGYGLSKVATMTNAEK